MNNKITGNQPSVISDQPSTSTTTGQQQPRRSLRKRKLVADGPSSSSFQQTDNNPSTEDLKKEILKEYVSVKKRQDDKYVASDGYDYFNLDDAIPPEPELCPLPLFPSQKQAKEETTKLHNLRKPITQEPVTILDKFPEPPQMTYWVNINKNIIGKEELQLHSYPYISDSRAVVDPKLNQRLAELYPEGIHGSDEGCGKDLNDWMLYHIATAILKRHGWESNEQLEHLMKTMQKLFPRKGSSKAFMKSYLVSKRRYDPDSIPPRTQIYDKDGKFTAHHSPQDVMNVFQKRMCKKCSSIGCIMHPNSEDDVHIAREDVDGENDGESSENEKPCGDHCYKNKTGPSKEKEVEWNVQEKTWFDMLQVAGIKKSCQISMLFCNAYEGCNKTCKQVHDYAQSKETLSRETFDTNRIQGNTRKIQSISNKQRDAFLRTYIGKFNNSHQYKACKHTGPCTTENGCSCKLLNIVCTKFCGCPTTCTSRFPGCKCAPGKCRTEKCLCYKASWECDPDLCQKCNCEGDGLNGIPICQNTHLQRGLIRKLYLDHSTIVGSGCFAENAIPKDGFIGEYNGEIISSDEGERRGVIADIKKSSYLFALNEEQCIDAESYGNILRFINNSKNPNCHPKILVVNGVHRIAFFALRDIKAGEELFFNYRYSHHSIQQHEMKEPSQQ